MQRFTVCTLAATIALLSIAAGVEPNTALPPGVWPEWRGDGKGVSVEKNLSLTWGTHHNVRWSVGVPGYGWSCPVVAGDKVFVTTAVSENQAPPINNGPPSGLPAPDAYFRWQVLCLDRASGKVLWQQTAAEHKPAEGNHPSNTFATETPITDGQHVYAYFGNVGMFCYDLSGKLVWSADLGAFKTFANWGTSSSPVCDGTRLFILCDNNERSFLIALDKNTGKEVWRVPRDERSTWSSPILWRNVQRAELVCMGSNYIRSYDPVSGRELWRLASEHSIALSGGGRSGLPGPPPGSSRSSGSGASGPGKPPAKGGTSGGGGGKAASGGCKSSPVANKDLLYVGMSSRNPGQEFGPLWAVKAGAIGDISLKEGQTSSAHIAWFRSDAGSHFTSPVLAGDLLYVFPAHAREPLTCLDAKTGTTLYQHDLEGSRGFKSSPCAVDGKIFNTDEGGTTFVIEAASTFKLLHKNTLEEMTWSSPAIAGGAVYLRTVVSQTLLSFMGGAETAQNILSLPNQILTPTP